MTGAHGIHVGLFHHDDVLEHYLLSHCTTEHRVRILSVDTLEIDALSVDVYELSVLFNLAETVAGGEHHLLLSGSVLLTHHDCIELRVFSGP